MPDREVGMKRGTASESPLESADEIGDHPQQAPRRSWFKVATLFGIPLIAILIFLSRPIAAWASRTLCYYFRGDIDYSWNPLYWSWHNNPVNAGRHALGSLYECEWSGYLFFNWPSVVDWLKDKGSAIVSSLGILGGGYATWQQIRAWIHRKTHMDESEKQKIKALAQHIQVQEAPDRKDPWVTVNEAVLRFSANSKKTKKKKKRNISDEGAPNLGTASSSVSTMESRGSQKHLH